MKNLPTILLPVLLLFTACSMDTSGSAENEDPEDTTVVYEEVTAPAPVHSDTFTLGRLSADAGNVEAIVVAPILKAAKSADATECEGDCASVIQFGGGLPELRHDSSIGGQVFNIGDITNSGTAEILFVPEWFSSCWSSLYVYTLEDNSWQELGNGSVYTCSKVDYSSRVKKGNGKYFTMVEDVFSEDGTQIVQQEKRINLKAQSNH